MSIISEFKEFAVKGNMIDMAVGIVIGAAFGTVVSSLVDDIIMPPIGMLLSGVDFSNLEWVLKAADADGEGGVAISYGAFINNIISFLVVAVAIFLVIKVVNRLKRQAEEEPKAPAAPPEEVVLLTEIRDELKKRG
ncbi:MAG TPA: large-conductance mechanosensitive channel protein MscL [Wenzhouxiangella sp.]|nr:large-conductance mechanosensitive channel protein MscL [Wenzhouxiangella sp.]